MSNRHEPSVFQDHGTSPAGKLGGVTTNTAAHLTVRIVIGHVEKIGVGEIVV